MSSWMDELADITYKEAWNDTIKAMRREFRKNKIERLFQI